MDQIIEQIAHCIEFGKINRQSPFPPDMQGQDGADELTAQAIGDNISPDEILQKGLISAMNVVGQKFAENRIFVPQMLMSAKAMNSALEHLKPFFASGEVKRKGKLLIATVAGDLHDIGKNLVAMMIEGAGWEVIDLGVDAHTNKFIEYLKEDSDVVIGLSALLTTTMINMEDTVKQIKEQFPNTRIIIGGAPVTDKFRERIGADFYAPSPQEAVEFLNR